jgi:ribonuclease HII
MDEAGLGPNLGPFVVAATVWRVPGEPHEFDFWKAFDTILTRDPGKGDPRLHVADSKQVFQPHRGLESLERGVWSALRMCSGTANDFASLREKLVAPPTANRTAKLTRRDKSSLFDSDELSNARGPAESGATDDDHGTLPWYLDSFPLPTDLQGLSVEDAWRSHCRAIDVELVTVRAEVVEPLRFNRLVRHYDNKSQATSRIAMSLLGRVWNPDEEPALVVVDKHGGRNRYDELLAETFDRDVECVVEGADLSAYRIGVGEIRFQPRAESHGPVALASMVAKYLRETAMRQFNRYWQALVPDLKPTQGYPVDAKRFHAAIADEQRRMGISDDCLWRER